MPPLIPDPLPAECASLGANKQYAAATHRAGWTLTDWAPREITPPWLRGRLPGPPRMNRQARGALPPIHVLGSHRSEVGVPRDVHDITRAGEPHTMTN